MSQQILTIFDKFCKYVDDTIFSTEYKGSVVAFVIDQGFINDFCKKYDTNEKTLLYDVSRRFDSYHSTDVRHVKGHLAIQLFAVSKMAESNGLSAKNYRDRLADLLNIETTELAAWLRENQDDYWKSLYKWCDFNDFEIAKCHPNTGLPYGYVQYPIQQAERVLKEHDLKYIACYFADENLQPDDDLSFNQFWSILSWHRISVYCNLRARTIVTCYAYEARRQIFNYFLRWNGDYIRSKQLLNVEKDNQLLYLKEGYQTLEVRDENLELKESLNLSSLKLSQFKEHYKERREGIIIFKPDDIYENIWIETRYIEKGKEGIAVVFNSSPQRNNFREKDLIKRYSYLCVYKIHDTYDMKGYYDEERNYWLDGGFKIRHNTYLKGAAPIFYYKGNCKFWIDNERPEHTNNKVNLNYLSEGKHIIKVKDYKAIEITIVEPKIFPNWLLRHNTWQLDRTNIYWGSSEGEGAVGLDFSIYTCTETNKSKDINTLNSWAKTFCKFETTSQNKAIVTLKNILK